MSVPDLVSYCPRVLFILLGSDRCSLRSRGRTLSRNHRTRLNFDCSLILRPDIDLEEQVRVREPQLIKPNPIVISRPFF
jgi:hypothetical protein